jgi:hypothetical protein
MVVLHLVLIQMLVGELPTLLCQIIQLVVVVVQQPLVVLVTVQTHLVVVVLAKRGHL